MAIFETLAVLAQVHSYSVTGHNCTVGEVQRKGLARLSRRKAQQILDDLYGQGLITRHEYMWRPAVKSVRYLPAMGDANLHFLHAAYNIDADLRSAYPQAYKALSYRLAEMIDRRYS